MYEDNVPRSWLRNAKEGKAEEVKARERKDKEEEAKRERWKTEGSKLRVNGCVLFFSSCLIPQEEGAKVVPFASFRESGDGVSDGELADEAFVSVVRADSVLASDSVDLSACVVDLTASPDSESDD